MFNDMFEREKPKRRTYCVGCATRLGKVVAKEAGYKWDDLPAEGKDHYVKVGAAVLHEVTEIMNDDTEVHEESGVYDA